MSGVDLVEFLNARLDEDEQLARAAAADGDGWKLHDHESDYWLITDRSGEVVVYDEGSPTEAQAAHIARHDPARVLADVAAKRQIIEEQTNAGGCQGHPGPWMPHADYRDHGGGYCRDYDGNSTLRWLASPYADHPDYRQEWKP